MCPSSKTQSKINNEKLEQYTVYVQSNKLKKIDWHQALLFWHFSGNFWTNYCNALMHLLLTLKSDQCCEKVTRQT